MKKGKVYICHHIDTEGPLYESIEELFERVFFVTGIRLEPSDENIKKLQNRKINISDDLWNELKMVIDPHTINFLGTWDKIDFMLDKIMSKKFRNQLTDSYGEGWIYNWHVMDHVGFTGSNPRRRDLGYLKIFDYYKRKIEETNSLTDSLHWHFHPIAFKKDAHIPATSYDNSIHEIHQVISRRLLDRNWFPLINRAGFHTVRFDSNLFLEQWMPFDPSNQALDESLQPKFQKDLTDGRFGDWRGAPTDWSIYNPDYKDWRKKGNMNRYVARILNMNSRHRNINETELEKAFRSAELGKNVYVGITNHDWRDMAKEIDDFRDLLKRVLKKFPEVEFSFSESKKAFQEILFSEKEVKENAVELTANLLNNKLKVDVINGELFGPQPYLAIKTRQQEYYHDNFDFNSTDGKSFIYTFDDYTIAINEIESVAIATNDKYGNQFIKKISIN